MKEFLKEFGVGFLVLTLLIGSICLVGWVIGGIITPIIYNTSYGLLTDIGVGLASMILVAIWAFIIWAVGNEVLALYRKNKQ